MSWNIQQENVWDCTPLLSGDPGSVGSNIALCDPWSEGRALYTTQSTEEGEIESLGTRSCCVPQLMVSCVVCSPTVTLCGGVVLEDPIVNNSLNKDAPWFMTL